MCVFIAFEESSFFYSFSTRASNKNLTYLLGDVHYLITCSEEGVHLWDIRRHPTYAQFIEHSVNEQSSSKPDESFPFGKSGINMESMSWLGSTTPIPDKKAVPWDLPLASFHVVSFCPLARSHF
jgi:hypothetical protein